MFEGHRVCNKIGLSGEMLGQGGKYQEAYWKLTPFIDTITKGFYNNNNV